MSKPVKELIRKELIKRFEGVSSLALVAFTGVDAIATHQIRRRLRDKNIHLTVVKNSVARKAFEAVGLPEAKALLDGPCAVAFGGDAENLEVVTIVRELLDIGKDQPNFKVKAAVLEGEVFGSERIKALSEFPTRDESIANIAACLLGPGGKLAACLLGPGGAVASVLKAVQDETDAADEEQAA